MRLVMSSLPIPPSSVAQTRHHIFNTAAVAPPVQQSLYASDECQEGGNGPQKPKTIRFRLSELCRQGHIQLARQIFDTIPQPTTVTWNTIIIGYICNDMPHEAIYLYSSMFRAITSCSSFRQMCDAYTYSSILKACAETKQFLVGKAVHCHILRTCANPSRTVHNSLLNMYATCVQNAVHEVEIDLVKRVFKNMPKRNAISWNIMISWYAKTNQFVESVDHFVLMMRMGAKPTVVSFVNVFPAVSALVDIDIANVFYGMVMKLGDEYVNDLFIVSSAINMYADLGCLDLAKRIFDNCSEKNTHIWSCMIRSYAQNNCPIAALELFNRALEALDDDNVEDLTLLAALTAASQLQNLKVSEQLHGYLCKVSMDSPVTIHNALIAMYSRCNWIFEAFKVFSGMQERDVVSWNTMIFALVQDGLDDEGLMLVYEMQKQGFLVDDVTIAALLSAASNLRNREIGEQTHAYLIRHGIQFSGMESYIIDMYAKSGLMQAAEAIFDRTCKLTRDQAIWNAIISGSMQNGLIGNSFVIFQQMLEENIMPNSVTLASILPACSQTGSIALGKLLHGFSIRNSLDKNVFVISAMVDMYSKSGAIFYAERVFMNSTEKNSVTYTNMISGYGQHGMGEKALLLFHSMRNFGISPDAVTFVAVLSACSYTGLIDEGMEIFESMESEYGIRSSAEHYSCVVDMLGRVGRVDEAYDFAQRLGKDGDVLGIWGSLLAACKVHRKFELGKSVANKLLEMEASDRITGYRVLLSNIHAEEQNWEEVKSVRKDMLRKGMTKEVGCSWIDVSGYANCFVSKDRKHPNCGEIYRLLKELSDNMKEVCHTYPFLFSEC